jgi:hypothetical protein
MVKKLIIRLIYEFGSKGLNSIFKAYKETVKNKPNPNTNQNKNQENKNDDKSPFGKFSFNNLISHPMTKEEAMKILNLKEPDVKPENIMEQFDKYFEANDPDKGGSFYIQNKIFYAKEFLMENFPKEFNQSKFNPGSNFKASDKKEEPKEDEKTKNDINDKI